MKKGFDTWEEARSVYDMSVENISLNQWLNMWGRLCRGTAGISGESYFLNTFSNFSCNNFFQFQF